MKIIARRLKLKFIVWCIFTDILSFIGLLLLVVNGESAAKDAVYPFVIAGIFFIVASIDFLLPTNELLICKGLYKPKRKRNI